ncbi:hypothetical protein ZHAS_00020370 [Anopheles sinensis]|uniref:Uncharacterized protein n=1 Tax=Anopheles sinensis TaxID=74873 RepID=A0A084WPW1_ANOSI|nr:hypothetical protein ZHAS_00020370 [Anopheles sinensis]
MAGCLQWKIPPPFSCPLPPDVAACLRDACPQNDRSLLHGVPLLASYIWLLYRTSLNVDRPRQSKTAPVAP